MSSRLDYNQYPQALKALQGMQLYVNACKIEEPLRHLVFLRVSQINGCGFCIDMHATEARQGGESQQRLDLLSVWRELPSLFTARERAALGWAEALTLLAQSGAPDDVYDEAAAQFSPDEFIDLTMAINAINCWNRFGVGFRGEPPKRANRNKPKE